MTPPVPWQKAHAAIKRLIETTTDQPWTAYQDETAQAIVRASVNQTGEELVVQMSRQSGKSTCVADVAAGMMLLLPELYPEKWPNGGSVGFFGPTYDRSQLIFKKLRESLRPEALEAFGVSVTQKNGNTHSLSNGSFARCLTANKETSTEGNTWSICAIVDECQEVDDDVLLRNIWPQTVATGAPKIMIGTTYTEKKYFYTALQKYAGTPNCLLFDVDRVIADRRSLYDRTGDSRLLLYEKDFRQQLALRGKDDAIRMSFYLEWILERGMFITEERLAELALPYEQVSRFEFPCYAGLDLGKEMDSTVLTVASEHAPIDLTVKTPSGTPVFLKRGETLWDADAQRRHLFILCWLDFEGDRYTTQMAEVARFLTRFPRLVNCSWDRTGVGRGVEDILWEESRRTFLGDQKRPLEEVFNAFDFGGSQQTLSDFWEELMRMMPGKGLVHFPMGKAWNSAMGLRVAQGFVPKETHAFIREMTDLQKVWRGPMLKCMVEEGGGRHDDRPASLALCNWGVTKSGGGRIDLLANDYNAETGEFSEDALTVDSLFEDEPGSVPDQFGAIDYLLGDDRGPAAPQRERKGPKQTPPQFW